MLATIGLRLEFLHPDNPGPERRDRTTSQTVQRAACLVAHAGRPTRSIDAYSGHSYDHLRGRSVTVRHVTAARRETPARCRMRAGSMWISRPCCLWRTAAHGLLDRCWRVAAAMFNAAIELLERRGLGFARGPSNKSVLVPTLTR
jgi:hypothetical protein